MSYLGQVTKTIAVTRKAARRLRWAKRTLDQIRRLPEVNR